MHCLHAWYDVPYPWDPAALSWHPQGMYCTIWGSEPVRYWSPILIPRMHVGSIVPNPGDPAAPSWYLLGMYDLFFRAHEILQPRPDTSYACRKFCTLPVRSCSHNNMPRCHVRYDVPYPWDPAAPSWYPLGMYDLLFRTLAILQPRPDTLYACWNCCSLPVRNCSHTSIPRSHVRFNVPYPWELAVPSWYLVGLLDLLFQTREILQNRTDTS